MKSPYYWQGYREGNEDGRSVRETEIIASLGNCPCNCPATSCECGCGDEPEFTRNELIALIKGENE